MRAGPAPTVVVAAAFYSALAAAPAAAQAISDDSWVRLGVHLADVDSSVRISGSSGLVGSDIDFETDLALDEWRALPAISGGTRLGGNWILTGDFFSLSRRGTRAIQREIVVDDVVYPVGAELTSGFRSTTFRLAAGYSLLRGPRHELGAALGLHLTHFAASVEGRGSVGTATASFQRRARDLLAPLPTLGVYGMVAPFPDVTIGGRADYLKLKISDTTGALINAEGSISWRVFGNVGIGAAYRHIDYSVDVDKKRWDGGIGYRFSGPLVFVEIGF